MKKEFQSITFGTEENGSKYAIRQTYSKNSNNISHEEYIVIELCEDHESVFYFTYGGDIFEPAVITKILGTDYTGRAILYQCQWHSSINMHGYNTMILTRPKQTYVLWMEFIKLESFNVTCFVDNKK